MRDLNTLHITDYTPTYRRTNSIGRRQLMTPDEVLRLPPDDELVFIRGQKVFRAKRFDYSHHPEAKKLRNSKAILHEPAWRASETPNTQESHHYFQASTHAHAVPETESEQKPQQQTPAASKEPAVLGRKCAPENIM